MNILYLSPGHFPDYQSDMLLHGLRTNYGSAVVDYPPVPYLYQSYPADKRLRLYGMGFTLYGLLPDIPIDRSHILERIRSHDFDLIIYGSIQRHQPMLDLVRKHYARHEILFIDGEDQQHGLCDLAQHGLYFKRELVEPQPGVFPIHFAIPSVKIGTIKPLQKDRVRASIDPRDRSTYIYQSERDYYADYARSLFAITTRKGGWDALRHYEIMANSCIPLFLDLDQCPATTCMQLPKPELLEALSLIDRDGAYWDTDEGHSVWLSLWRRIHLKFVCYSTTERLAQYVIEVAESHDKSSLAAGAKP